jgi:amino-acid N-acetyltransferase
MEIQQKYLDIMNKIVEQTLIRDATTNDLMNIKSLLESVSLPSVDIDDHIHNFLILEYAGTPIGTIGMEIYGETALLRSLAVRKEYQFDGYGKRLCRKLILNAERKSIKDIYLLTNTAEKYFSRKGFQRISRERVPEAIKKTYEYSTLCPTDSTCMVKALI